MSYLPSIYFCVFACYVMVVRMLYEPINKNNLATVKEIINNYVKYLGVYYGDYAYDFTIHAHLHLVKQNIIPGEEITFTSIDSLVCDDPEENLHFPTEYINSLTPSGMPPQELKLKIGAIVMLLRNLNSSNGQCNGTRAIIRGIKDFFKL